MLHWLWYHSRFAVAVRKNVHRCVNRCVEMQRDDMGEVHACGRRWSRKIHVAYWQDPNENVHRIPGDKLDGFIAATGVESGYLGAMAYVRAECSET